MVKKNLQGIKTSLFNKIILSILAIALLLSTTGCESDTSNKLVESDNKDKIIESVENNNNQDTKEDVKEDEEPEKEELNLELVEAEVTKHIDGDTVHVTLKDGKVLKLRMIGVDTPETVHPSKPVEFYGKEASNFTKGKLLGKTVYLEKDVSDTDKYDRALRYIWLEKPTEINKEEIKNKMFNGMLVAEGYANVSTFPPDVKYQEYFIELEREAREQNLGLWDESKLKEFESANAKEVKKTSTKSNNTSKPNSTTDKGSTTTNKSTSSTSAKNKVSSNTGNTSTGSTNKKTTTSSGGKTSNKASSSSSTQTGQGEVYVTPTGSKYHRRACGRGNYSATTLKNAKSRGLEPCKKCY